MRITVGFLLAASALPRVAYGEWHYSGEFAVRADQFKDGQPGYLATFRSDGYAAFGEQRWSLDLGWEADYDSTEDQLRVYPRDFRINYTISSDSTISIGWQRQLWGRADEINPVDFAFADDRRRPYLEPKGERKRSRLALGLNQRWSDSELQLFYFPKSDKHDLPKVDSRWCDLDCRRSYPEIQAEQFRAMGLEVEFTDEYEPSDEFGARISGNMGQIDYGLSAFYGTDHWPRVSRSFLAADVVVLQQSSVKEFSAGIDVAFALDGVVIRAELATFNNTRFYIEPDRPDYPADNDGLREEDIIVAIAGFDYTTSSGVYINAQYMDTSFLDDSRDLVLPKEMELMTLQLSRDFYTPEVKIEWGFLVDRSTRDWVSDISAALSLRQGLVVTAGALFFSGESSEYGYGMFEDNNSVYLKTVYLF